MHSFACPFAPFPTLVCAFWHVSPTSASSCERVCNIIEYAGWLGRPIPCTGNLGACPIPDEETRRQVRQYADVAWREGEILATGAEKRFPYRGPQGWLNGKRKASQGCLDVRDKDDVGKLFEFLHGCQDRLAKRQRGEGSTVS
jgi:hypothetical protein